MDARATRLTAFSQSYTAEKLVGNTQVGISAILTGDNASTTMHYSPASRLYTGLLSEVNNSLCVSAFKITIHLFHGHQWALGNGVRQAQLPMQF